MVFMGKKITFFSAEYGKITYDGSSTKDILFIEGKVIERDFSALEKRYGTSKILDLDEAKQLVRGSPWEVIVGTGFESPISLTPDAEYFLKQKTALLVLPTKEAVERLNSTIKRGLKVNALMHVIG